MKILIPLYFKPPPQSILFSLWEANSPFFCRMSLPDMQISVVLPNGSAAQGAAEVFPGYSALLPAGLFSRPFGALQMCRLRRRRLPGPAPAGGPTSCAPKKSAEEGRSRGLPPWAACPGCARSARRATADLRPKSRLRRLASETRSADRSRGRSAPRPRLESAARTRPYEPEL